MATWDVFHSDRLEVERGLSTAAVRAALARGDLRDDDLIRPAGTTTPWARLVDTPVLFELEPEPAPAPAPAPEPGPPAAAGAGAAAAYPGDFEEVDLLDEAEFEVLADDDGGDDDGGPFPAAGSVAAADRGVAATEPDGGAYGEFDLSFRARSQDDRPDSASIELVTWDDDLDEFDPQEEDEAAAEFTLSRGAPERVEELDLAAMVDVAFQLVLFFLVTATTVLFKSLEVPRPNPESAPPAAAAQGRSKTLDDLKDDFILVEVDPAGAVKIDREPVPADLPALAERLRSARERTGRKAMLLSADFATPHRSAVLAYDAANEIGLGIAIARPSPNPAPGAP